MRFSHLAAIAAIGFATPALAQMAGPQNQSPSAASGGMAGVTVQKTTSRQTGHSSMGDKMKAGMAGPAVSGNTGMSAGMSHGPMAQGGMNGMKSAGSMSGPAAGGMKAGAKTDDKNNPKPRGS